MDWQRLIEDVMVSVQRIAVAVSLIFVLIIGLYRCVGDVVQCIPYEKNPDMFIGKPEICR